jgi:hypothetical protein
MMPIPTKKSKALPKTQLKTIALTAETVARLGAPRLAQLVLELSAGDAAFKRRLKIELSGPQGAAHAIAKRLATIAKSKSYIDWRKVRVFHDELLDQRAMIMDKIAPSDPGAALALLWQFMALAPPLLDRTFDMSGSLVVVFAETLPMLATLALAAKPALGVLAAQVCDGVLDNGYATYDGLIAHMAAPLGPEGLAILRDMVMDAQTSKVTHMVKAENASHQRACQSALRDIADANGDVDAFIASYAETDRQLPGVAAQISQRLLKAGRAGEALAVLDGGTQDVAQASPLWQSVRADTLEALGRGDDAQAFRLACFKASLNSDLLRAHIKRLPDFDDEEALDAALLYAQTFPDLTQALRFLINWPSLKHAAARIIQDAPLLDGNAYEWLTHLGKLLDENHPLAATLVRRAMVEYGLEKSKTKRYKYIARHIRECEGSAAHIVDWQGHADHLAWLTPLLRDHPRKFGVWDLI